MIGIINYGAGNIQSVANALEKIGEKYVFIGKPEMLSRVEKVILPGVGAAGYAMERLVELGFDGALRKLEIPFLGICLGMQILADYSEEGEVDCLGIIPGKVKKFENAIGLKVPQIGWNKVDFLKKSKLVEGLSNGEFFYFVNSYYFEGEQKYVIGESNYGATFPSVIQRKNFYAVQFHPEKSGESGLKLIRNFCEKC